MKKVFLRLGFLFLFLFLFFPSSLGIFCLRLWVFVFYFFFSLLLWVSSVVPRHIWKLKLIFTQPKISSTALDRGLTMTKYPPPHHAVPHTKSDSLSSSQVVASAGPGTWWS